MTMTTRQFDSYCRFRPLESGRDDYDFCWGQQNFLFSGMYEGWKWKRKWKWKWSWCFSSHQWYITLLLISFVPLALKDLVMNPRSKMKTLLNERKAWACFLSGLGHWEGSGRWDWDTSFISSLAFVSDARWMARGILAIGIMDAAGRAAPL